MKFTIHPRKILSRKLDSIISDSPFFFQNTGLKLMNSELLFFSVKNTKYTRIQINLTPEDENFSKYFFRKMNLSLNFFQLSYFIGGEGDKYPSSWNSKYMGQEFLICNNLIVNETSSKILHTRIQTRKVYDRLLFLSIKEIVSFVRNLSFFSTRIEFKMCGIKNLFNNEESKYSNFLLETQNLINSDKEKKNLRKQSAEKGQTVCITIGNKGDCVIGLHKRIKKFWYNYNIKDRYLNLKNHRICKKIKRIFLIKRIYSRNFIHLSNWNEEISDMRFLKLNCTTNWTWKEISRGLKECDLDSKNPLSITNSLFLLRKKANYTSSIFDMFLNFKFENIESHFFVFSIEQFSISKIESWKLRCLCYENDFNKLLFRINNSAFRKNEINNTCGIEGSKKNRLLFNNYNFQKIYCDDIHFSSDLIFIQPEINHIFNFKNYNFSLGRSIKYSKF